MFPELGQYLDYALIAVRLMLGAIFIDSGRNHLSNVAERAKSLGLPKPVTAFLGCAEVAGGLGVLLGIWPQLAAIGLMLIMAGAIQKKVFVWKTGFWGKDGFGWYYDLTMVSMLLVVLTTDGGRFVILR